MTKSDHDWDATTFGFELEDLTLGILLVLESMSCFSEEAFVFLKSYLRTSFSTVLLFTTTKDVTFKINKKGAGSITENSPTFHNVTRAKNDAE